MKRGFDELIAVVVEESAVETTEEAAEKSAGDAIETDKETMGEGLRTSGG